MRSKNVLTGSVATAILSLANIISGLLIPRLIILHYGSAVNGLTSSITQFISYFSLLEAGLAGSAIYAMYKPLAEKDHEQLNGILSASKKYYDKISLWYFLGVCAFSLIYAAFVDTALDYLTVVLLVLALGSGGVLEFATMSRYRVLLTSAQKTDVVSFAAILGVVLKVGLTYVLVWLKAPIVLVKLIPGLSVLLRSAILAYYVKKKFSWVRYDAPPDHSALKQRFDVLLMQVLGSVQQAFPTVAMTVFGIPMAQISVYTVYATVTSGLKSLLQVFLNGSIYASFGEVITRKDYTTLRKATGEFETGSYWLMSVIFGCLAVLYMPFVEVYTRGMTDVEYLRPEFALLMGLNAYLYVIKNPLASMIQAAGHYRKTRWRTVAQAAIAVVVGVALVIPLGIPGILIGMICSNLYRTVDLLHYVPKYITDTSPWMSVFRMAGSALSVAAVYFSFTALFTVEAAGYFQWFLWAMLAGVWSVVICTAVTLLVSRRELLGLVSRVKHLLKRRK